MTSSLVATLYSLDLKLSSFYFDIVGRDNEVVHTWQIRNVIEARMALPISTRNS
jgi:hypothetical protein